MKIVMCIPTLYSASSPFNHILYDFINAIAEKGHQITMIIAKNKKQKDSYESLFNNPKIEYISVFRKESNHSSFISRFLRDILTSKKQAKIIKKISADLLIEDVSYTSFYTINEANKKGMKIISMLQDVWPDNAVQSGLIGQDSFIYRFFEALQKSGIILYINIFNSLFFCGRYFIYN